MLIIISGPACLLSFYLAFLCYRQARYRHTLILALIALFMLFITAGVIGAGYFTSLAIKAETAGL